MAVTRSHTIPIEMYIEGDAVEISAEIDYHIGAGSPAHMGSLSYPGHPAEPAEIEIESVALVIIDKTSSPPETIRQEAPQWLVNFIANSDGVFQALGEAADWGEDQGPDPDDWYDARYDRAGDIMRSRVHKPAPNRG